MVVYSTKIEIAGINVTSNIIGWKVFSSKESPDDNRAELNFDTDVFGTVATFDIASTLKIYKGNASDNLTKIFSGKIHKYTYGAGTVTVIGRDPLWELKNRLVTKSYDKNIDTEAGVISAIATDLIVSRGELSANVVSSGTVFTLDKYICNKDTISERLYSLAAVLNWVVYWDNANEQVVFEPEGNTFYANDLIVGTNVMNLPFWDIDKQGMINKMTIEGAVRRDTPTESFNGDGAEDTFTLTNTPKDTEVKVDSVLQVRGISDSTVTFDYVVDETLKKVIFETGSIPSSGTNNVVIKYTTDVPNPVIAKNTTSIDRFDLQEDSKHFDDIKTIADAILRGINIISKIGLPFNKTILQVVGEYGLNVSNKVKVIDSQQGKNIELTAQDIIYQFPEGYDIVKVGDKDFRLNDLLDNIRARILELERQESVNIGVLNQVFDFVRNIILQRRYFKFQIQDASMDGEWGVGFGDGISQNDLVWGETGALWQANYTNSPIDNVIIQGRNTYEEQFYDEDFNDGGDATWDTSNRRIDFTSGQTRILGPFSLGIIHTFFTASVGTVTGSLLTEISADGKVSWQTIGLVRTAFTNADATGVYIRLTENNTSTARIENNVNANGEIDAPGVKCILEGG